MRLRQAYGEADSKATEKLRNSERPPVTREILLPATRAEVWVALTSVELSSRWLGDVIELEPRPGGAVLVRDADGILRRGLVELAEPEEVLVLRWRRLEDAGGSLAVGAASRVTFRLEDDGPATRLVVVEEPAALVASREGP